MLEGEDALKNKSLALPSCARQRNTQLHIEEIISISAMYLSVKFASVDGNIISLYLDPAIQYFSFYLFI